MKQRMNRQKISQLQMDRAEHEMKRNMTKTYNCVSCSKAIREEDIITADAFRIMDPGGEVRYLVGYRFSCSKDLIKPFYDARYRCMCTQGDDASAHNCQTCMYSEPYMVQILNEVPKGGKAKKWAKPPKNNCIAHRILYRCKNLIRMEQFNEGTFMCAYIKCDHYKKREEK